jgi:hypothetical protein
MKVFMAHLVSEQSDEFVKQQTDQENQIDTEKEE